MRLILFFTACLWALSATAETVALGERTPKLKECEFLDHKVPAMSPFTYIVFAHSQNDTCREAIMMGTELVSVMPEMTMIVFSKEEATSIRPWMQDIVSERIGVVPSADVIFTDFGVHYAPFAILVDRKRKVLWFGNPERAKESIERLINGINKIRK